MVVHWCDLIGDENPCYLDPEFAGRSAHGGLVAPPAMLDVWDRRGLKFERTGLDPRGRVLARLEDAGFTAVVAVNSELEFVRYLRAGDAVGHVQMLEDVSPEKQTALGVGHFVTTLHRYTTNDGEHVGDLRFRILKFKPGSGAGRPAPDGATAPDPDPRLRPKPAVNRDNAFFWEGAKQRELRIQSCDKCGTLHFPPMPRCAECGSFDQGFIIASGRGVLYSYAVPHYPQVNGFSYPLLVGLVELDEGTRIVANIVGCRREDLRVGMPLEVDWLDAGEYLLPQFRPATPARRTETLRVGEVSVGDELPLFAVPVTPTLIVGGAIETRDYTEVHHDRDRAQRHGSADMFMNINTSVGLLQRYVSDWAGPELQFRAIRVRLGVPSYPYDALTFTGAVESVDGELVKVTVRASNKLGDHVTGSAEIVLPK